jgi:hypothetical protein
LKFYLQKKYLKFYLQKKYLKFYLQKKYLIIIIQTVVINVRPVVELQKIALTVRESEL